MNRRSEWIAQHVDRLLTDCGVLAPYGKSPFSGAVHRDLALSMAIVAASYARAGSDIPETLLADTSSIRGQLNTSACRGDLSITSVSELMSLIGQDASVWFDNLSGYAAEFFSSKRDAAPFGEEIELVATSIDRALGRTWTHSSLDFTRGDLIRGLSDVMVGEGGYYGTGPGSRYRKADVPFTELMALGVTIQAVSLCINYAIYRNGEIDDAEYLALGGRPCWQQDEIAGGKVIAAVLGEPAINQPSVSALGIHTLAGIMVPGLVKGGADAMEVVDMLLGRVEELFATVEKAGELIRQL